MSGAAMARFEGARGELWAHMSGEGVSARRSEPGWDEAEESGRGMGLNSEALALREREVRRGEAGRLAVHWAWAWVAWAWARIGDEEGE